MSTRNLDRLFDPKTIVVIGASNKKGSVGYILLRNLIGAEYEGVVYPVNPSSPAVQGIQAYASISQVPRKIDLAVIAVPAASGQEVADRLILSGVLGLLNLAFTHILSPKTVPVIDVRILASLRELCYAIRASGPLRGVAGGLRSPG